MSKEASNTIRSQFTQLLLNHNYEAVSDLQLREHFQERYTQLVPHINELMSEGRLKIFQQDGGLGYALVKEEDAEKLRGLTTEQTLVLLEIEKSGNVGIWTRDIKNGTSLPQQVITKILRVLETRRLVKSVKSIGSKNKKLYMLFDLVPSREITGGPWYNEQEFDHVFIDALSKFVYEVIKASGMANLKQICEKVDISGISKVSLGSEELMSIVKTLIYDGKIEEVRDPRMGQGLDTNYKTSNQVSDFSFLSETPCGVCPVFNQCQEGNTISPSTCIYMDTWLHQKDIDF